MNFKKKLKNATQETQQSHFRTWKKGKNWLYGASVLAVLTAGAVITTVSPNIPGLTLTAHAATLPSGFTEYGTAGDGKTIYQTDAGDNDVNSTKMQQLFSSLAVGSQPNYVVTKAGWQSNTSYSGKSLASLNSNTVNDFLAGSDGFSGTDNYNFVTPGQNVLVQNVGTAKKISDGSTLNLSLAVQFNYATYDNGAGETYGLGAPGLTSWDAVSKALLAIHNKNGAITVGVMLPNDTGSNGGGGVGGEGGGGASGSDGGSGLSWQVPLSVNLSYQLLDASNNQPLDANTLVGVKIADIDAGQQAYIHTSGSVGYAVGNPTNLKLDNGWLTASSGNATTNDGTNLNENSYLALMHSSAFNTNFLDTLGNRGQTNIIQSLFGKATDIKLNVAVKNTLVKTEDGKASPTGVSQKGAVYKVLNTDTNKYVTAADALDSGTPIKATAGTMGTDSDGNLTFTTDNSGKTGIMNLKGLDDNQKPYHYKWVEFDAPNGEAINSDGPTFSADPNKQPDATDQNVATPDSSHTDKPLLEAQLDKASTNDAVFGNYLGNATYKLQDKNASGTWVDVKKADGLDPATGKTADVKIVTGSDETGSDGILTVKATSDGKIDVKNIDSTKYTKDVRWVEVKPADGHALNDNPAGATFVADQFSGDNLNLLASAKTTDKPMGETKVVKVDADTNNSTTQGNATLAGAEATLYVRTSNSGTTTVQGKSYPGTWVPVKQTQGVDPKTGDAANVVLSNGATYAADANGNVVLTSDKAGNWGQVSNIDLTNYTHYAWLETTAPYGYTRNTNMQEFDILPTNALDKDDNNYQDSNKMDSTIKDRVVDFNFDFIKWVNDQGSTSGLNGAEFTLSPIDPTADLLGKYDNGPDTNINDQDTYNDAKTGLPTQVTNVNQLHLGDTQTSHSYRNVNGTVSDGLVRFDHIPVGSYDLDESKVPDGYQKANKLRIDILPGDDKPAPESYEFKVTDTVTGKVLVDQTYKVSYDAGSAAGSETDDPTQSTIQLTDDDNSIGLFSPTGNGGINDKPATPKAIVTTATDASDNDQTIGVGQAQGADKSVISGLDAGDYTIVTKWVKSTDGSQVATTQKDFTSQGSGTDTVTTTETIDTTNLTGQKITAEEFVYPKGQTSGTPIVSEENYQTNPSQTLTVAKPTGSTKVDNPDVPLTAATVQVKDHYTGSGYAPGTKVTVTIKEAYSTALKKTIPVSGEGTFTADGKGNVAGDIMVSVNLADFFKELGDNTDTSLVFYEQAKVGDLVTVDNHNPNTPNETIKPKTPKPSIDDEKTDKAPGKPGAGNNTDKDNNDGANDRDTAQSALVVAPGQATTIYSFDTNNGNEPETNITWEDKTISGEKVVDWTHEFQSADGKTKYAITIDPKTGFFLDNKGKVLTWYPGDHILSQGTLKGIAPGTVHEDQTSITATGVISGKKVSDKDKWNGKSATPTIKTKAHTDNGDQIIDQNESKAYDKVELTNVAAGEQGVAYLHRVVSDTSGKDVSDDVVATVNFKIDDAVAKAKETQVETNLDKSKDQNLPSGQTVRYVWGENLYKAGDDTSKATPLAKYYDAKDTAETLNVPKSQTSNSSLPDTGTAIAMVLTALGATGAIGSLAYVIKRKVTK